MSSTSTNQLLHQAYEYVSEDVTFLRLTTISTIVHSGIFVVIIMYNLTQVLSKINYQRSSTIMTEITSMAQQVMDNNSIWGPIIIIAIILAIGYYILPPIGEAAMIYHLEKKHNNKSGSSFSKGIRKFFVMFERNSLLSFISVSTWLIIMSRIWILDIFDQAIMIPVIIMYSLVVIATVILTPYVKFKLVVENESFGVAIKESIMLAISQPVVTLRLAIVGFLLNLRIILNIIILVGVPAALFYAAYILNLHQTTGFYIILGGVLVCLFLLIAYINSIIEAFFMTYWYLGYRMIEPDSHTI